MLPKEEVENEMWKSAFDVCVWCQDQEWRGGVRHVSKIENRKPPTHCRSMLETNMSPNQRRLWYILREIVFIFYWRLHISLHLYLGGTASHQWFGTSSIHFWCELLSLVQYLKAMRVHPKLLPRHTHIIPSYIYVDVAINLNAQIQSFFFWNKEILFSQHFLCRPNFCCFLLTSDTWQLMREISKIPTRRYLGGQLETRNLLKLGKVHWFHTQLKRRFGILQSCRTINCKFFTDLQIFSIKVLICLCQ